MLKLLSLQRYYNDKMQKEQNKTKGPWGHFLKVFGINIGLLIVAVLALVWALSAWLDVYTRHDERINVPDLTGIEADEATAFLERMGLNATVIDSVYTDARPGSVIEQLPAAGLPVKNGRMIYLTINAKSQRMVKMADVREWSSRQAQTRLRELGFIVDSVKQVASEFDDLVLSVTTNGSEVIPGKEYPYHTRLVMRVGSTHVEIEANNDSIENEWF